MVKCNSCGNYITENEEICNKCYQSNGNGLTPSKSDNSSNTIVDCKWLHENIGNRNLIILDCSSFSNKSGITPKHKDSYIPNASHFNLSKGFTDPSAEFPNTFPSEQQFNANCKKLGINQNSLIVIYDNIGIYNSARVWWMFQTMGHQNVFVLDGGLPEWIRQDYPISKALDQTQEIGNFQGLKNKGVIKDFHFMKTYAPICTVQVIDARSKGRFDGIAPEPRKGLNSGSIPYSINIPFQEVLVDGKLKSKDELNDIFEIVTENNRPKVFTCGSGLTACILLLAAQHIGINDLNIYDGSWTEWATKTQ